MKDERKARIYAAYAEPVSRLLKIGEPAARNSEEWPDYRATFSITEEHIADLARMTVDLDLEGLPTEVWAPVHAWRALAQLGTEAAIEPLATLLDGSDGDDYAAAELPYGFGLIGPAAIPALKAFIDDQSRAAVPVSTAIDALKEIGVRHPEARAECIMILTSIFKQKPARESFTNGCVVAALCHLRAVEAIEDMREAFDRQIVDPSVAGDMEDVEIDLGLKTIRSSPRPFYPLFPGHTPEMFQRRMPREPAVSTKTGRNDPCPCGSGKKYKKCCLA